MITVMGRRIVDAGRLIGRAEVDVLRDGKPGIFEEAVRPPGTRLLITSADGMRLRMTEEFRHESHSPDPDLRLPGGKVFDTLDRFVPYYLAGEEVPLDMILAAARDEARQEAAVILGEARLRERSINGSSMVWDLYYIEAVAVEEVGQDLEPGESIKPVWKTLDEVHAALRARAVREDRSRAVLWDYVVERLARD